MKVAIIVALALAAIPAVATVAWPSRADTSDVTRSVELSGPIMGFSQSRQRIQVRLTPPALNEQRSEILVRDSAGVLSQTIPLKHGQTWASAELSAELAGASALQISVK